jgi:hypothetical protein
MGAPRKNSYAMVAKRLGNIDMQYLPNETASGQAIVAAEMSPWWECGCEARA